MGRLRVKWEGNTEEDSKGGIIGRIWQGVIQKRPVIQEERGRGSQLQTMSLLRNRIKHRRPPVAWCYLTNQVLLQSTSTSNSMLPSLFTNSFNHRLSLRIPIMMLISIFIAHNAYGTPDRVIKELCPTPRLHFLIPCF